MKTKQKRVRYSEAELKVLNLAVQNHQTSATDLAKEISKKFDRPHTSIYAYILKERKKLGFGNRKSSVKSPSFKQGEFIIPVNNWEVRNDNGNTMLVLKFNKTF